jgi:probable F420-dependent oxidoreductase
VQLGVTMFATDRAISVVDLAVAAEQRGLRSLYVPEHTHIPTSRRTPPPTGEPELAEEYRRTLDPFVALTAAAVVTAKLRVGTGICLLAQRDPIVTAKAVASIDHLSGGRFVFGVGFGWNREEMADHGVDYRARRAIVREKVLAIQRIWEDDEASYTGAHVAFSPSWSWPKPVQRPRPPLLLGGAARPTLFAHVIEYADGWIPIGGAGLTKALPELRDLAERAGRDPATLRVVPFGTVPDRGKLDHYGSLGIDEVVLRVPSAPPETVLPLLDDYARYVDYVEA